MIFNYCCNQGAVEKADNKKADSQKGGQKKGVQKSQQKKPLTIKMFFFCSLSDVAIGLSL
jgi:hypothetical protein